MAILQKIIVREPPEELMKLLSKSDTSVKPRVMMLLAILHGITRTEELVLKTKTNRESIQNRKNTYRVYLTTFVVPGKDMPYKCAIATGAPQQQPSLDSKFSYVTFLIHISWWCLRSILTCDIIICPNIRDLGYKI